MLMAHRFGKYEVIEEVGQGGMSVVYRGRDSVLGREVAIKVMHPFLAQKKEAKERFYREARTVARLDHPNVLEIFDYSGEDAEQAYIVTEFIRGETLSGFIGRHRPALPEIGLLLIRPLCHALKHAHDSGIIHRDLKPDNVMIRVGGTMKLMDFGIAQMIDADTLTMTGALLGSPAHMSPELIDGLHCDARSDIFSMGTILYWLMTTRLPFTAPTAPALFKKIVDGAFDDPRMHNPLLTPRMVGLLDGLMKRRREERFQTVGEVLAAVDAELKHVGIEHSDEWLQRYLAAPADVEAELRSHAIKWARQQGDAALQRKDIPGAIDAYDRVLLLDPADVALRNQVLTLSRRKARRERVSKIMMGAQGLGLLLALGVGGLALATMYRSEGDLPLGLSDLRKAPAFTRRIIEAERPRPQPIAPSDASGSKASGPEPTPVVAAPRDVQFSVFPFGSLFLDNELKAEDMLKPLTLSVPVGKHEVRVENPFRETIRRTIDVPAQGDITPVHIRMDAFKPGRLIVKSEPGAEVVVDGVPRGGAAGTEQTPISIPMLAGERTIDIKVVKVGRADKNAKVMVKAGQVKEFEAKW